MSVRVLVVDDDALVRSGLTLLLDGAHGISVVAQVADGSGVAAPRSTRTPSTSC